MRRVPYLRPVCSARYRVVPAQLKERRLRYNVKVRLLGGLRVDYDPNGSHPQFVPTVRKLPHLGARVGLPGGEVLAFLCNLGAQTDTAQTIGYFSLGEIIYNGGEPAGEAYLLPQPEAYPVNFDVQSLISRRSFVFARDGYGKSNMLKLLISQLYSGDGPKDKSGRPVGMLILDPEGEYFWPDEDGRPGLCNVPHLKDKIAVFTDRVERNAYYGSWKVGCIKLDVREMSPSDVVTMPMPDDSLIPGRATEKVALKGSVLSTVHDGGPKWTVGRTVFEMWLGAL